MLIKTLFQRSIKDVSIFGLVALLAACGSGSGGSKGSETNIAPLSSDSKSSSSSQASNSSTASSPLPIASNQPSAQVMFPAPVSLTEGSDVLVRGTAYDKSHKIVSVKVNGLAATTTDNYANWQIRVPLVPQKNTLTVSVKNDAGKTNTSAASLAITRSAVVWQADDVVIDSERNRILVADSLLKAIVAVDLTTGYGSILTENLSANDRPYSNASRIVLDATHNRLLLVDRKLNRLDAVDLDTGARSAVSTFGSNAGELCTSGPGRLALDAAHNRGLMLCGKDIVAIDLTSGEKTLFLRNTAVFGASSDYDYLTSIATDAKNDRALILYKNAIYAIDLNSRATRLLAENITSTDAFGSTSLNAITLDRLHDRALVLNAGNVMAVDLNTGKSSTLSDDEGAKPNVRGYFGCAAIDEINNRALIAGTGFQTIVAVDLTTGARTRVFQPLFPDEINEQDKFNHNEVTDSARNRRLTINLAPESILAVDLTTGVSKVISDITTSKGINMFDYPFNINFDSARDIATVIDGGRKGIIVIDLVTGERVFLSDH